MEFDREKFFPKGQGNLLLHCCCAPCSCSIIERFLQEKIGLEIFFYNPNIHPRPEYDLRKNEIIRYANKKGIRSIDAEYDPERWIELVRGHETDPEQGERCSLCFEMRLLRTAEYAAARGFSVISTTLGISRRKNFDRVTEAGRRAALSVSGVHYLDCNWRKKGGAERADAIEKAEAFYRQAYCGCCYSFPKNS